MLVDVVQNGKENDKQFFVEIDLAFLVDGIEIDGNVLLNDGLRVAYGLCPVDFVVTRMLVA